MVAMGLLQTLGFKSAEKQTVEAQYAPAVMDTTYGYGSFNTNSAFGYNGVGIDRNFALQVASVSRCRNLIAGVISSIDLSLYKKSTGEKLGSPVWLEQPDQRQPRSVTIAATVDSLIFYSVAYWRVTSLYADDGRPSGFEWVANNRVTYTTNQYGTEVKDYFVDGNLVPMAGIGSLVTFQSLIPGVLQTAGTTIKAAWDVQRAAAVSAATPMATTILKNNGADLPESQIQGLLAGWNSARKNRSTAYLTSTLTAENIGFSPKEMGYVDFSQYLATEIARSMNVPAYYISADMNNSMTYQNILDGRKEFVAYSLQPYISAIEDRLSMNDITNSQNQVRFAVDDTFLRVDAKDRLDIIEKMINLDLISVEQARQMEQLTPLGDTSATNV
jgi:HK97 family phage portal protein